jgi:hypothetical protein
LNCVPTEKPLSPDRSRKPFLLLCGVVSLLAAGLVTYSQTMAFAWDEGYHLLAAQLILAGKRPYLDFLFPQTPLNTYWNAFWLWIFGGAWRAPHAVAALMTAAATLLAADFVLRRMPVARWRFAAAITTALAVGLNVIVVEFGTVGQAYGLCLFFCVAAFRLSVVAVAKRNLFRTALAGLFAGAAAGSTLLASAVLPVLLVWILWNNRAGSRWAKAAAYVTGAIVAFFPLLRLFVESPRHVLFSVIEYQLLHRNLRWPGATTNNIEVLLSWIDCAHALTLGLLAVAGLLFLHHCDWERPRRAEFYLCGWLALALGLHISTAHPTFSRYYLLLVPFLGILAAVGLYALSARLCPSRRPLLPAASVALLLLAGLGKTLFEDRDDFTWNDLAPMLAKVEEVTPRNAVLLADEHIYALSGRRPPSGMELMDSHKLILPEDFAARLHIVTDAGLKRQILAGTFDTVQTCESAERVEELQLKKIYSKHEEFDECNVFWDKH